MIGGPIGYDPIGGVVAVTSPPPVVETSNAYRRLLLQWIGSDVRDPEYVKALEEATKVDVPALIQEAPLKKKKKKTKADAAGDEAQKLTSVSRQVDQQLHLVEAIVQPEEVPKGLSASDVIERLIRDRKNRQALEKKLAELDDEDVALLLLLSD